jgi:hypothetical protein
MWEVALQQVVLCGEAQCWVCPGGLLGQAEGFDSTGCGGGAQVSCPLGHQLEQTPHVNKLYNSKGYQAPHQESVQEEWRQR